MKPLPPVSLCLGSASRPRSGIDRAFSLVEVTLAIGIVSFAVLAMVGVNATSWQILSQARDAELGRNIHRAVSAGLLDSPFASLPVTGQTEIWFFDEAGFEVVDRSLANYRARIIGQGGTGAGGGLAGDASRVFEVRIEQSPGGIELSNPRLLFSGPVVVGRREKN